MPTIADYWSFMDTTPEVFQKFEIIDLEFRLAHTYAQQGRLSVYDFQNIAKTCISEARMLDLTDEEKAILSKVESEVDAYYSAKDPKEAKAHRSELANQWADLHSGLVKRCNVDSTKYRSFEGVKERTMMPGWETELIPEDKRIPRILGA